MALEVREIGALVAQHSQFVQDVIQAMERVIVGHHRQVRLLRPYQELHKVDVMRRGRGLPLQWTFSCIHPVAGQHCGRRHPSTDLGRKRRSREDRHPIVESRPELALEHLRTTQQRGRFKPLAAVNYERVSLDVGCKLLRKGAHVA